MQNTINQGVADYLNNKYGDDYTMAEPFFGNPIHLEQEIKEIVLRNWSDEMDAIIRRYYRESDGNEMKNLLGFIR